MKLVLLAIILGFSFSVYSDSTSWATYDGKFQIDTYSTDNKSNINVSLKTLMQEKCGKIVINLRFKEIAENVFKLKPRMSFLKKVCNADARYENTVITSKTVTLNFTRSSQTETEAIILTPEGYSLHIEEDEHSGFYLL